jgi:hypothetical protein
VITLLVGVGACSSQAPGTKPDDMSVEEHKKHAEKQQADKQQMMMAKMCPMKVEGTTRQIVKLDDAVAMDFTTTGDVEELRQRVQKMPQMHQKMHAEGGMMSGVTVTTEKIDAGMRAKFTPKDAAHADKLYQMMQKHSQMMEENGQCPMMQMMGGGPVEEQNE